MGWVPILPVKPALKDDGQKIFLCLRIKEKEKRNNRFLPIDSVTNFVALFHRSCLDEAERVKMDTFI